LTFSADPGWRAGAELLGRLNLSKPCGNPLDISIYTTIRSAMTTFQILPVDLDPKGGWVVKTTHDDGKIDISIVYDTQAKAQAAADSWTYLDEDWAKV
jgi:hypothetical protein